MSRLLGLIADPADEASIAALAQALGVPFDVQNVGGTNGVSPADGLAAALKSVAASYRYVAAPSAMWSKDLLPRLAALNDAIALTDITAIAGPNRWVRPVFAGSLLATVETDDAPVYLTFRPAGFPASSASPEERKETPGVAGKAVRESVAQGASKRPDLTRAKIVVSGGRPLKDAETFERVLGGFADSLGAAVGATRAAVDSGIAPNELQVGQTGKIVAPDLYIAAGISGSTQHMAGIKDSRTIVAINKDASAPIFDTADIGIVGDLYDVLPELQKRLGR